MDLTSIQPVSAIIGATLGAIITATVTIWFVVKRKKVVFAITRTEDLTSGLRQHHQFISFNIANRAVLSLNKATIHVKNSGNTTIKDLKFDVVIPGNHEFYAAEVDVPDPNLKSSVKVDWKVPGNPFCPHCEVSVPYFNAKESFDLLVFFDGSPELIEVSCRLEDVSSKVVAAIDLFGEGPPLTAKQAIIRGILKGLAGVTPFGNVR